MSALERLCPVCASAAARDWLQRDAYRIVRCHQCGCLYVRNPPPPSALEAIYQAPAYFKGTSLVGYDHYERDRPDIEALADDRLRRIERWSKPGRLLDVGCAFGYFLARAKAQGWEVAGVDLAPLAVERTRALCGLTVARTIEEAPPGPYHAVTMWEFLEHVNDPRTVLMSATSRLVPGGVLALSTPNAGCWVARCRPDTWREFKPPAHLTFFTRDPLERLLLSCGLRPCAVRYIALEPGMRWGAWHARLERVKAIVGDRIVKRTPWWWTYSALRRLTALWQAAYGSWVLRASSCGQGIEVYARRST